MAFNWIGKSSDGNTITLHKLKNEMLQLPNYFTPEWVANNPGIIQFGAVIDVETTGLDHQTDKIIDIGLQVFQYNRLTGEIVSLGEGYTELQDPKERLSEEIMTLTGIDDEMLKGQAINWNTVDNLVSNCEIIIAHNASFDRPFIDKFSSVSRNKLWGCSLSQIDWKFYGFPSGKLENLCIYHGFFTDAHRALNDVSALIHLLNHKNNTNQTTYLLELLNLSSRPAFFIKAANSPFEKKDMLKSRGYYWDSGKRVWCREMNEEQRSAEIEWLEDNVYNGEFGGESVKIKAIDRFKK